MNDVWFTADTHFSHRLVALEIRKFKTLEEHDECLITNWNSVVKAGDRVYHLGDFALTDPSTANNRARRLNGEIYFIKGNHDRFQATAKILSRFVWVKDYFELTVNAQKIILSHYPFLTWRSSHKGTWMLHGHCHNNLPKDLKGKRLDVGVDGFNYFPISFDEVKTLMEKKTIDLVDHHIA